MNDEHKRKIAKGLSQNMGNLFVALGIYFVFGILLALVNTLLLDNFLSSTVEQAIQTAVLVGLLFSDPVQAWKEKRISSSVWKAMAGGAAFAVLIAFYANWAVELGDKYIYALIALPALIFPIMMAGPALKKLTDQKEKPVSEKAPEALQEFLNTSGPLIMMFVMGICMLFFYLAQLPLQALLAFLGTLLLAISIYCAVFFSGQKDPIFDEESQAQFERPNGLQETFSRILEVSIEMLPGSLFMTGLIWVSLAFWNFEEIHSIGEATDVWAIVWPIIEACLLAILIVPGGMLIAGAVGGAIISASAYLRGAGIGEAEMRMKKFAEILYGMAMAKLFHASLKPEE